MAGDAAQRAGVLVVHDAVDVGVAVHRVHLRRRDAREQRVVRIVRRGAVLARPRRRRGERVEPRVVHPQRTPHPLLQEHVQRLARQPLDDQPREDQVPVAVDRRVARRVGERTGVDRGEVLLPSAGRAPQRRVGDEPRVVREHHPHRDARLLRRVQLRQVLT